MKIRVMLSKSKNILKKKIIWERGQIVGPKAPPKWLPLSLSDHTNFSVFIKQAIHHFHLPKLQTIIINTQNTKHL